MPAIITHHLFGEEAAGRLPSELSFEEQELLAFLLGNQGPDPYYFCFTATPATIQACHGFATVMHEGHEVEALLAVRNAVAFLPEEDRGIGRAFALGLVAHYLLDSEAHAFIVGQEQAICAAGVGLEDAHAQVHALIESELDTWMLWSARAQTIADAPAHGDLARTKRVSRVAGALFSQVALQVFDLALGADRYEGCLRDYELIYRTVDPAGNLRAAMLAGAERLGARYSILQALAHTETPDQACPAANLDCKPWTDPLDGTLRTTSFPDIFYDSLERWPALAEAFVRGNQESFEKLVMRRYDGAPLA